MEYSCGFGVWSLHRPRLVKSVDMTIFLPKSVLASLGCRVVRTVNFLTVPYCLFALTTSANAAPAEEGVDNIKVRSPFRGSTLTYEHAASAVSLSRAADLTYNPFYEHRFSLRPEYHFDDVFFATLQVDVSQELTNADDTTTQHEFVLGDLLLTAGAGGVDLPIPVVDLVGGADILVTLPMSKASRAQTLTIGFAPGLSVRRHFDIFGGLDIGFSARFSYYFNRFTTAQLSTPWIACGSVDALTCGQYIHTGDRNAESMFTFGPSLEVEITDELKFSSSFQIRRSSLYAMSNATVPGATGPISTRDAAEDVSARWAELFVADLSYEINEQLSVSFGTFNSYPQLTPASSYRAPLFNRFSQLYLDLTVDIEAVAALL